MTGKGRPITICANDITDEKLKEKRERAKVASLERYYKKKDELKYEQERLYLIFPNSKVKSVGHGYITIIVHKKDLSYFGEEARDFDLMRDKAISLLPNSKVKSTVFGITIRLNKLDFDKIM